MRLFTLTTVLFSGVSSVLAKAKRDSGLPYFDIYQGPNTQESIRQLPWNIPSPGQPYPNPYMVGTEGPLLIQSTNLVIIFVSGSIVRPSCTSFQIEHLAYFVREQVPERTVHANGAGAHGWFKVTTDVALKHSMAKVFDTVGRHTSVTARLSTIAGNLGNPDTVRDLRGLAFKLRTEEGILDWVFLNHPVFWLRDPAKFPHFIHSQKRNPQTDLLDHNLDYLSGNNESIYQVHHMPDTHPSKYLCWVTQVMRTMSDLGTPYGFRYMNGFSGNTFRAVVSDTEWYYIKTIAVSDQGIKNNTNQESIVQAGLCWTVYWQIMTPQQAENYRFNIFDLTKEWLQDEIPYQEIGRITLMQNPTNYFNEVEQIGFDPSHMPNGLEATEDPTLQAPNFLRDGSMNFNNQGKRPNFWSQQDIRPYNDDNHTIWVGGAVKYVSTPTEQDFELPRIFWNGLSETDQKHLIYNVVWHLGQATDTNVINRQLKVFQHVNETLGQLIAQGLNMTIS
ncbi:catalase-like domain-containing protein [Lanmaoa asiatica]|nr:catalase-like domain-containing protein [Lanmaoa asiatica]